MYFYYIWVRSVRYRGREALTYVAPRRLPVGTLVKVPLQKEKVLGVVVGPSDKPAFAVKPIDTIYDLPPIPRQLLELTTWMQQFYTAPLGVTTQQILPAAITKPRKPPLPTTAAVSGGALPPLTREQSAVLKRITVSNTYLLHGRTGSGKTRIYIELAKRAMAKGSSAIVLSPEIGLSSQLARTFMDSFGTRVIILHSQLTPAQRQAAWLSILQANEPLIVIGPRSALFSPLKSIDLIVVDESHEPAYKQEQAPYYHVTRVAAQLAQLYGATLILGSATPLISDYFMAQQRHKPILRLTAPAVTKHPTSLSHTIVDLKDRTQFSRGTHLSDALLEAIDRALSRHEQTLLYLNRRGTARMVVCENCGWQAICPHCDLPLAYHADTYQLQCHTCGYRQSPPSSCPTCGQPRVVYRSIGTKAIVEEVRHLFPAARVQRFDTDNRKLERLEHNFSAVHAGEVDILVGTQMLAKGLDLPRLSTLGLVAADSSLSLPDFTAAERTYQLISQVLGRVGRGHRDGYAIIQTYTPERPLLKAAITDDWEYFYDTELEERRKYFFPPFCHLLQLTCRRASARSAETAAESLKADLLEHIPGLTIEGPAPSFHEKAGGKVQWQLVVKAQNRSSLLHALSLLPKSGWSYNIDPVNLL